MSVETLYVEFQRAVENSAIRAGILDIIDKLLRALGVVEIPLAQGRAERGEHRSHDRVEFACSRVQCIQSCAGIGGLASDHGRFAGER